MPHNSCTRKICKENRKAFHLLKMKTVDGVVVMLRHGTFITSFALILGSKLLIIA